MDKELKFYTYTQNNSGGYYILNEDVGLAIIAQAHSPIEADAIARNITDDYSIYCECCGERWWIDSDDFDGNEEPMFFSAVLKNVIDYTHDIGNYAVIYPYDKPRYYTNLMGK